MKQWKTRLTVLPSSSNEIDWPWVHQEISPQLIEWIQSHPHTECQLVIEHQPYLSHLTVEFYSQHLWEQFLTDWAPSLLEKAAKRPAR